MRLKVSLERENVGKGRRLTSGPIYNPCLFQSSSEVIPNANFSSAQNEILLIVKSPSIWLSKETEISDMPSLEIKQKKVSDKNKINLP